MIIYSPNTKSPTIFSKNTVKDKGEIIINDKSNIINENKSIVSISSKVCATGTTIEFEPKKKQMLSKSLSSEVISHYGLI